MLFLMPSICDVSTEREGGRSERKAREKKGDREKNRVYEETNVGINITTGNDSIKIDNLMSSFASRIDVLIIALKNYDDSFSIKNL